MAELKARVLQLHATEAEWNQKTQFIPRIAEFIVYDPDEKHPYPRFKIGDGESVLADLSFYSIDVSDTVDGGKIDEYPIKDSGDNING